jgi:hypothetical protein
MIISLKKLNEIRISIIKCENYKSLNDICIFKSKSKRQASYGKE